MSLKENVLKIANYPTRDAIASTRRDGAKHPTNPNLYWNKSSGKICFLSVNGAEFLKTQ